MRNSGYFKPSDPRIDDIRYANWGSRPYEYQWVIEKINELNISNMKVIDLGIGQPSLHGWPMFFKDRFRHDLYVGIDCNPDLDKEGVESGTFRLQKMDMTQICYPDKTFNLGICISTFEHFSSLKDFIKSFKEINRVLEDDSYLIVTLDELWDGSKKIIPDAYWSFLDSTLRDNGYKFIDGISFSVFDFIHFIEPFFKPVEMPKDKKLNADTNILHHEYYNDAISYCILEKVN